MYRREKVFGAFALRLMRLAAGVALTTAHAAVAAAQPALGASLKVEQVSADPLPYQAVRMRIVMRNDDRGVLANLPIAGPRIFIGRADDVMRPIQHATVALVSELPYYLSPYDCGEYDFHFDLSRGEEVSWSYPLSWNQLSDVDLKSRTPLFPEPGKYRLRVEYDIPQQKQHDGFLRKAIITITVREPKGEDKIIYEMLRQNQELAHELALPIYDPLDAVYDQISEIVDKFPESSYANYARFALARRQLHGTGFPAWHRIPLGEERITRDVIKTVVQTAVKKIEPGSDIDAVARDFSQAISRGARGKRLQVIRNALVALQDPNQRDASVELLTDMMWVSPHDRRAAQRLLLGVLDRDCAYYPNVRASLKMSLLGDDPEWEQRINDEMDKNHYDAVVWMSVRMFEIRQRRPWRDFRVRYVPKKSVK